MKNFKLMLIGSLFFALTYFTTIYILKSLENDVKLIIDDYTIETVDIYKPLFTRYVVLKEKKTGLVISVKDCIKHHVALFPIESFECNKDRITL